MKAPSRRNWRAVPIAVALLWLAGPAACSSKVPIGRQAQPAPDGAASTGNEVGDAPDSSAAGASDAATGLADGQRTDASDAPIGQTDGMQGSGGAAQGGMGGVGSGGGGGGGSDARGLEVEAWDAPGNGGATGGAIGSGGTLSLGGTIGSGGVAGSGAATGGGGATGPGGATGLGGTASSGGATGSDGGPGTGGSTGSGGSTSPIAGPCDIYAAAIPPTPCVAAYSMVRVLSSTYSGPLYQVRSGSSNRNTGTGGTIQDIRAVNGLADTDTQDVFCSGSTCTVSILYDQSGNGNHLTVAPKGCSTGTSSEDDYESSATKHPLTVGGHKVYALYMNAHEAYRNNQTTSMPTGAAAQGIYELADGSHSGTGCCWDFGNASTDNCSRTGSLNALFFGAGAWAKGTGGGPWFMGDSGGGTWPDDSGVWACGTSCSNAIPAMAFDYAFGTLSTELSKGAIRGGNARSGDLFTIYDGQVQAKWSMEGGIVLGIREDNSNSSYGTFYEGAITSGRPSSTTDAAIFKNVQAAGYGK